MSSMLNFPCVNTACGKEENDKTKRKRANLLTFTDNKISQTQKISSRKRGNKKAQQQQQQIYLLLNHKRKVINFQKNYVTNQGLSWEANKRERRNL
jgi:hypothetical protein